MPEPAVSVVIPTFNRSASLRRLLDALAGCEVPEGGFEVIVVDDGSSDDTRAVVEGAGVPVRYVRQDNAGPASARNRGWRLSRSPIVAFTDDDTVPDRRWLVDVAAELGARPDLSGLGGTVRPLHRGFLADFVQLERLVGHGADGRGVRFLVTANAAYRTEALRRVEGFDEGFPTPAGEDTDLSIRVREDGGRLGVTPSAAVLHDHRTSMRNLFRTYFRHGAARHRLAAQHPALDVAPAVRAIAGPSYWVERYRYYRAEGHVGPVVAVAYCGLRAAGLAAFAAGMRSAGRR